MTEKNPSSTKATAAAKATLTDRYVDAAMRTVPESQRVDLAAELRASIADQIDARIEQGEQKDAAERAVLTGLGDPDRLAAGFTDRPQWLIGPRYYFDWKRLLTLLLWIVPPFAAFGIALGQTLAGAPFGSIVGSTVVGVLTVVVHLGFWTTLVFAIIERAGQAADAKAAPLTTWSPDQLPEPRESGAKLSDAVATIVFLALAAGALLWDRFIGFVPTEPGLSFFDPALWPWWIAALFSIMAVEAVLHVVVHVRGRWTWATAGVNAALALAVAIPALWLLFEGRLVNPGFWPTLLETGAAEVGGVIAVITGFVIAGIAAWDAIDAFLKAYRAR